MQIPIPFTLLAYRRRKMGGGAALSFANLSSNSLAVQNRKGVGAPPSLPRELPYPSPVRPDSAVGEIFFCTKGDWPQGLVTHPAEEVVKRSVVRLGGDSLLESSGRRTLREKWPKFISPAHPFTSYIL